MKPPKDGWSRLQCVRVGGPKRHPVTLSPWEWVTVMEALEMRVDQLEHEVRGGRLVVQDLERLIESQAREIQALKEGPRTARS